MGGGSAGSVVASRLSEVAEWRVLLLEAGDTPPVESYVPGFAPMLIGTRVDWAYRIEPQTYCHRGYEGDVSVAFVEGVLVAYLLYC